MSALRVFAASSLCGLILCLPAVPQQTTPPTTTTPPAAPQPDPNEPYSTLAPANNYFALLPFTKDSTLTDGKVDYTISDKDHLSGRFSFQRPVVYQAPIFGMAGGDANGAFEGTGI